MSEETKKKKSVLADHIQKNTMAPEELERELLAFIDEASSHPGTVDGPGCPLKHGLACVLCTVHNGEPRATPIDFFADGMTLWLRRGTGPENPQYTLQSKRWLSASIMPWTIACLTAACR